MSWIWEEKRVKISEAVVEFDSAESKRFEIVGQIRARRKIFFILFPVSAPRSDFARRYQPKEPLLDDINESPGGRLKLADFVYETLPSYMRDE